MSFEPSPLQALLIWKLILTGEEPAISKARPDVKPKGRKELENAQFIEIVPRGRTKHIILLDRAWLWAEDNMDMAITTRSPEVKTVLHKVLSLLKIYMQTNNMRLSEFVQFRSRIGTPDAALLSTPEPPAPAVYTEAELEQKIRDAYFQASRGEARVRVRLWRLRQILSPIPRPVLDEALRKLMLEGSIILYPLDDPWEMKNEDKEAQKERKIVG